MRLQRWLVGTVSLCSAAGAAPVPPGELVDADSVRAAVAQVLADAETRSSLLQGSAGGGHDGKFYLASGDGSYRLNLSGQALFRYTANFRDDDSASDDFEPGFSYARMRLLFDGHVVDPRLTYRVMGGFDRANGNFMLEDALVGYAFDGGWSVRGGQGITWFQRDWNMGDWKLLTFERSFQALVFGQQRSQFVEGKYQSESIRVVGTFSDGFRSQNTDFVADPADAGLTARAEWKFAGPWAALDAEHRSPRGSPYAGALGGAVHYEIGPDTGAAGATEQDLFAWTADVFVKGDGWNVQVAGNGYHVQDEAGAAGADFDDFGLLVEGGYHLTEKLEVIARYDGIFPDDDRAANDDWNALTLGANYYVAGQAAKLNLAVVWFLDATSDTVAGNFGNTGGKTPTSTLFASLPSTEDNQVSLVAQFQLLF